MAKKNCTFCGEPGGDHAACVEAWGLDYDPTSERDSRAFLDRRRRIMDGETVPMNAGAYAAVDRVGQTIYTYPMGGWPGGKCVVTEMFPDREGAPEIVMQVRRVEDGDECGVFEYEYVELLVNAEPCMNGLAATAGG